jgi:hypothetical protein
VCRPGAKLGINYQRTLRSATPRRILQAYNVLQMRNDPKLDMGLIGTITAILIGLLIASAKSFSDTQNTKLAVSRVLDAMWPNGGFENSEMASAPRGAEVLNEKIQELSPQNEAQRLLQNQPLNVAIDLAKTRCPILQERSTSSVSPALLVVLFSGSLLFSVALRVATSFGQGAPQFVALVIALLSSFLFFTPQSYAQAHTKGRAMAPFTSSLKPGDYAWHPELSPAGPVVVLVNLPDQLLYVYRNGVRIAHSTVSTGKPGKTTPTGVFTVLQKKVSHTSTIYKGAQMPHMQRLTWSGIALHAGHLPGYPASAGCVRMPVDFAARLYSVTGIGTTVIIADNKSAPDHTVRPGLLFSGKTGPPAAGGFRWVPEKAPKGPISIIISAPDRKVYVYRNSVEIGRAPLTGLDSSRLAGTFVYSADSTVDSRGRRDWIYTASVGKKAPNLKDLEDRISIDPSFLQDVLALITPGTTLVLTNAPVSSQTHSGPGFNILTTVATR